MKKGIVKKEAGSKQWMESYNNCPGPFGAVNWRRANARSLGCSHMIGNTLPCIATNGNYQAMPAGVR
jgi:hypothetical protein